jgi:hypothetical protein
VICPTCGDEQPVFKPACRTTDAEAWCNTCQTERTPTPFHAIRKHDAGIMEMTLQTIGIPPCDIVWARNGTQYLGLEMSGDRPSLGLHQPA